MRRMECGAVPPLVIALSSAPNRSIRPTRSICTRSRARWIISPGSSPQGEPTNEHSATLCPVHGWLVETQCVLYSLHGARNNGGVRGCLCAGAARRGGALEPGRSGFQRLAAGAEKSAVACVSPGFTRNLRLSHLELVQHHAHYHAHDVCRWQTGATKDDHRYRTRC